MEFETKGVSIALFFLAIIDLTHYRSKSKTGLRTQLILKNKLEAAPLVY
jgi:hypothetical protein